MAETAQKSPHGDAGVRRASPPRPPPSSRFLRKAEKTPSFLVVFLCHCMTLESYRTAGSHRPGLMQDFIDLWGEFWFPAGCSEERGAAGRLRRTREHGSSSSHRRDGLPPHPDFPLWLSLSQLRDPPRRSTLGPARTSRRLWRSFPVNSTFKYYPRSMASHGKRIPSALPSTPSSREEPLRCEAACYHSPRMWVNRFRSNPA